MASPLPVLKPQLLTLPEPAPSPARPGAAPVDLAALEAELRRVVDGEVRFDDVSRAIYAADASNYRQPPIGVVLPRTKEAAVAAVAVAHHFGVPILSRGGGTSLAGQCCNTAVVLDFSKYMHHVLEVDPERSVARIEPGCILDHLRSKTVEPHRLTYAPDPSTHAWCTLGGMIGNNSCGVHSLMAGRTADNVVELEVVTYDGVRMRVGPTTPAELDAIVSEGGRRAEIYQGLAALRDRYADLIRARYPDIPRRVSGYNLDDLLPEKDFHVARALVGSESTCVVVLEATVRLVHDPPCRAMVVLGFEDVCSAADHVPELLKHEPMALEGIDRTLVEHMRAEHMDLHPDLLPEGDGWLVVELGADSEEEVDAKMRRLVAAVEAMPAHPSTKIFEDDDEEQQIWDLREAGLGATAHVPNQPRSWPGWEDAAVPPARLGEYLREFRGLLDAYGYHAALYGHFGDGCIHCRIDFNLTDRDGIEHYKAFVAACADVVCRYGGSVSGEHGDGQARGWLLPRMYGEELIGAFRQFKALWDPAGMMNPGKVVDPAPPDAHLRLGTDYAPKPGPTHYAYTDDDGDFSRAVLRCVGVGKCRRPDDAFMCPSFVATRDELHTTRGRSHALFEMMHGGIVEGGWRSESVLRALDLCLGCKACKSECPVNVDMATWKSEFLAQHYKGRLRPRSAYAMGLIGVWARVAMAMPRLANFFGQTPGLSRLLKWAAGVAPERQMPRFATQSFRRWFRHFEVRADGKPVVLLPDLFNDSFFPHTLKAAARALTRLGYRVIVPGRVPAVRPALHYGMVERGREMLRELVQTLTPYARDAVPLVGLEPSSISVLRDELLELLPTSQDAQRVAKHAMLFSELLVRDEVPLPAMGGRAIFHAHCHAKAVLDADCAREVLKRMAVDFEEPWQGCCGMAGSFGFEVEHYAISQTIGEQALLPAVRAAAPDTAIVVEGFSCHTQIAQGTARQPIHLAELVERALEWGASGGVTPGLPAG